MSVLSNYKKTIKNLKKKQKGRWKVRKREKNGKM